jgi:penicillin-binding protein 1C
MLTTSRKKKLLFLTPFLFIYCCFLFWTCLPEPLFKDPISRVLISKNETLLGAKISEDQQWRFPLSETVPEKFATAIRVFEDKRFYSHPGIDPLAMLRSIYLNLKAQKIVSGGSTISMQVIRLARKNRKRTYFEKIKEIFLTLRLEVRYSKDEILKLYAAYAPFGGNVVGIEAAAFRYFGRKAHQLSWAESSLLAVLPNNPALVHPGRNRKTLQKKRDKLLKRLKDQGIISELVFKLSLLENLPKKPHALPRIAPHLLETLSTEKQKTDTSYQRTVVASTIQKNFQTKTAKVLKNHSRNLTARGIYNLAALVVDNETLEVLAYVGNRDASKSKQHGQAIDLIRRPRSTGSILKPFLFAGMLQNGEILPSTLVSDIPSQYYGYVPQNFDRKYRGAVPAGRALAKSLNIPAVRMLKKFGIQRFHDFLTNFGMTTLHRNASSYGLTLILGGAEGTLWDITGMYANMARIANLNIERKDVFQTYYQKLKIESEEDQKTNQIIEINPGTAWLTLNALLEVTRPGMESYWKNFSSTQKIAWKTGTSYGLRDAWAVGVTPKYTVGVWSGNASGEGHPEISGLNTSAPILFDIFNFLPKSDWFYEPAYFLREAKVCKVSGRLASPLCESAVSKIPVNSNYSDVCPYHKMIHLDPTEKHQVHSNCERVDKMVHTPWFILPALQEYYYRKYHSNYKPLPEFRKDCKKNQTASSIFKSMELVYPARNTVLYIPIQLDEQKSQTVFEAIHRTPNTTIYWHLDDKYIGSTQDFHKISYAPEKGERKLTLIDDKGYRLEQKFKVLERLKK